MVDTLDIVFHARECVGTPFQHQGRLAGVGLDCIGLLLHAGKQSGADLSDFEETPYQVRPNWIELREGLRKYLEVRWERGVSGTSIFRPFVQNGDVLVMANRFHPTHTGILALGKHGWNIIHSSNQVGKVCEHRLEGRWEDKVFGVYRFKGAR